MKHKNAGGFRIKYLKLLLILMITLWKCNHCCVPLCLCLGNAIDCSQSHFKQTPNNLPGWTELLDLSMNEITHVTSFESFTNLKELNLRSNKVEQVPSKWSSKLQKLIFSSNNLLSFPPSFVFHAPSLLVLDLSNNSIDRLEGLIFSKLNSLQRLYLNNNNLTELNDATFWGMGALKSLILEFNNLTTVTNKWLYGLTSLRKLSIAYNSIRTIEAHSWKYTPNLAHVDLSNNRLTSLYRKHFSGLKRLRKLEVQKNQIFFIQHATFAAMRQLHYLDLSHNLLDWTRTDGLFHSLHHLHTLNINHNPISLLSNHTFTGLSRLKSLHISSTHLRSIQPSTFSPLISLQTLESQCPNLVCDCGVAWMPQWFKHNTTMFNNNNNYNNENKNNNNNNNISHTINLITILKTPSFQCAYPAALTTQPLHILPTEHFTCDHSRPPILMQQPAAVVNGVDLHDVELRCDVGVDDVAGGGSGGFVAEWRKNNMKISGKHVQISTIVYTNQEYFNVINNISTTKNINNATKYNTTTYNNTTTSYETTTYNTTNYENNDENTPTLNKTKTSKDTNRNTIPNCTHAFYVVSRLRMANMTRKDEGYYRFVLSTMVGGVMSHKVRITANVFPKFIIKKSNDKEARGDSLTQITVKTGNLVFIDCYAEGVPKPTISMSKDDGDDFPAARERRLHLYPRDHRFIIVDVKRADQGTYTCTATNILGTAYHRTVLNVLGAPVLSKKPEDKKVTLNGETTVFECQATGNPMPKIIWLKHHLPLQLDQDHYVTEGGRFLIIRKSLARHQGIYTCVVSNSFGTDKHTSTLYVIPYRGYLVQNNTKSPRGAGSRAVEKKSGSNMMVVAIVSCLVCTSCAWLLIILVCATKNTLRRRKQPLPIQHHESSGLLSRYQECGGQGVSVLKADRCEEARLGEERELHMSDTRDSGGSRELLNDKHLQLGMCNKLKLNNIEEYKFNKDLHSTNCKELQQLQPLKLHENYLQFHHYNHSPFLLNKDLKRKRWGFVPNRVNMNSNNKSHTKDSNAGINEDFNGKNMINKTNIDDLNLNNNNNNNLNSNDNNVNSNIYNNAKHTTQKTDHNFDCISDSGSSSLLRQKGQTNDVNNNNITQS